MGLPLIRRSTHEEKIERLQNKKDELFEKVDHESTQRSLLSTGLKTVVEQLPKLDCSAGTVNVLESPHVAFKAVEEGIAVLIIPEGATVVYPTLRAQDKEFGPNKYRVDEAIVASINDVEVERDMFSERYSIKQELKRSSRSSTHKINAVDYVSGKTVIPDYLDEDTSRVCTNGIHVFKNKEDAVEWIKM